MGSLKKKLEIGKRHLTIVGLPPEVEPMLKKDAAWTKYDEMPEIQAEAVLAFAKTEAELNKLIPAVLAACGSETLLWFAYPKKNSGRYESDIGRDKSFGKLEKARLKLIRQIVIDEDWAGVLFRKA